jgi:hypothetical protein
MFEPKNEVKKYIYLFILACVMITIYIKNFYIRIFPFLRLNKM